MGTAEVESALVLHPLVAEAAVVGFPHDIKGQGIYAYVTLNVGVAADDDLRKTLAQWVRKEIGPIATPEPTQSPLGLPKTAPGRTIPRICRKIPAGEPTTPANISTPPNPAGATARSHIRQGHRRNSS